MAGRLRPSEILGGCACGVGASEHACGSWTWLRVPSGNGPSCDARGRLDDDRGRWTAWTCSACWPQAWRCRPLLVPAVWYACGLELRSNGSPDTTAEVHGTIEMAAEADADHVLSHPRAWCWWPCVDSAALRVQARRYNPLARDAARWRCIHFPWCRSHCCETVPAVAMEISLLPAECGVIRRNWQLKALWA
eukprot:jgi/Ulvmu1/1740/UM117_0017.1